MIRRLLSLIQPRPDRTIVQVCARCGAEVDRWVAVTWQEEYSDRGGISVWEAEAVAYRIDPQHSKVVFNVDHDGYSRTFGFMHVKQGTILFDRDLETKWERAISLLGFSPAMLSGDAASSR